MRLKQKENKNQFLLRNKKAATNNNNGPIGIFDSGIGGLTVAKAILKVLPNEQLVYFGDTAHFPYGDKSSDSIKYYAIRISQFLLKHNCKAIVIACNTASSMAFDVVRDFVGNKIPVINVIDPVVQKIIATKGLKKVGIIATKGTIKSDIYAKKIKSQSKNIQVASLATPLLASMIEEGFFNNKISRTIIHSYLSRPKLKKIDSLVLACTHYPLIKPEIEEYYKEKIHILDSAGIVAEYVQKVLEVEKLLSNSKSPKHHFFISDYTDSFEKSAQFFFKNRIKLKEAAIWQ